MDSLAGLSKRAVVWFVLKLVVRGYTRIVTGRYGPPVLPEIVIQLGGGRATRCGHNLLAKTMSSDRAFVRALGAEARAEKTLLGAAPAFRED